MKNLLKQTGYKFSALLTLLTLSTAVWAEGGKTVNASGSLSALQVVAGVACLVAAIVIPVFKSSNRIVTK